MNCVRCGSQFEPKHHLQKYCTKICHHQKRLADNRNYKPARNRKKRLLCLQHYSNGKMECACCSEARIEFLALDHVNGGGHQERKQSGRKGSQGTITWIINNNFPKGFRVLCHNCNQSLGAYGYCPHDKPEGCRGKPNKV